MERYSRQMLFAPIGKSGQELLQAKRMAIVGLGALGSVLASQLARAGVGHLTLIDRDFVELSNLGRQLLYDEEDASRSLPKAVAAREKLAAANSEVECEARVADLTPANAHFLLKGHDLLLDGSDNFAVRFLLNDYAVKHDVPWVYSACVASYGMMMPILPGRTACLRCLYSAPPAAGSLPTCETAGIIGPAAGVVASLAAAEALKILVGDLDHVSRALSIVDVWYNNLDRLDVRRREGDGGCPTCVEGRFDFLEGGRQDLATTSLCGRNAVQVTPGTLMAEAGAGAAPLDLGALAARLAPLGPVTTNQYLVRAAPGGQEVVVFRDGRAIIKGTTDPAVARSIYSRYVGG